jgi:hypothetical protein
MNPADGIVDCAVGLVDMAYGAIPHTPRLRHVFCPGGIVMRLIQQLQSLAEAAIGSHAYIDGRMIGEILAVIDRGPLDLGDRCIDLTNCMFFIPLYRWPGDLVQISARQT